METERADAGSIQPPRNTLHEGVPNTSGMSNQMLPDIQVSAHTEDCQELSDDEGRESDQDTEPVMSNLLAKMTCMGFGGRRKSEGDVAAMSRAFTESRGSSQLSPTHRAARDESKLRLGVKMETLGVAQDETDSKRNRSNSLPYAYDSLREFPIPLSLQQSDKVALSKQRRRSCTVELPSLEPIAEDSITTT